MYTQTVYQAGNSHVVTIPKELARQTGLKPGLKVTISPTADGEGVIITKQKRAPKTRSAKDFQKWLQYFMRENGEILDELAKR